MGVKAIRCEAGLALGLGQKATVRQVEEGLAQRGRKELAQEFKQHNLGRRACAHPSSTLPQRVVEALAEPVSKQEKGTDLEKMPVKQPKVKKDSEDASRFTTCLHEVEALRKDLQGHSEHLQRLHMEWTASQEQEGKRSSQLEASLSELESTCVKRSSAECSKLGEQLHQEISTSIVAANKGIETKLHREIEALRNDMLQHVRECCDHIVEKEHDKGYGKGAGYNKWQW